MVTLYTSATMCRRIVFGIFLTVTFMAQSVSAQIAVEELLEDDIYYEAPLRVPILSGEVFDDTPVAGEITEAVGTVIYATVPVYTSASRASRIVRHALPGEKLLIVDRTGDWFKVRMFNGREGYMERRFLRLTKVFFDESITTNHMNKRLNVELQNIFRRLEKDISGSIYLEKYHVAPRISLINSSMFGNNMTLTLEYSAVDPNGNIVPSRQINELGSEMQRFIELIFMKMLTIKTNSYTIILKQPQFSDSGRVLNMNREYAALTLNYNEATIDRIKSPNSSILGLTRSTMPVNELFRMYPH